MPHIYAVLLLSDVAWSTAWSSRRLPFEPEIAVDLNVCRVRRTSHDLSPSIRERSVMTLLPNCYARIWKGYRLNLAVIWRVRAAAEGIVG